MTKTNAPEIEIGHALAQRWPGYVLLHTRTQPAEVAKFFAARMGDTFSTSDIDAYVEALKKLYPHNVSEVAHILLETRERLQEKTVGNSAPLEPTIIIDDGETEREASVDELAQALVDLNEELDSRLVNPFRELPFDTYLGAKDVAEKLGRSYTYVKEHAEDLGGHKNGRGQWCFNVGILAGIFEAQLFKG